eukprot:4245032-Prymnesium_polylepis.1
MPRAVSKPRADCGGRPPCLAASCRPACARSSAALRIASSFAWRPREGRRAAVKVGRTARRGEGGQTGASRGRVPALERTEVGCGGRGGLCTEA